jgi:DNA-directed RNA polymerase specialized sigma24 family protein
MSHEGSVTRYIRGLKAGEQAALQKLWEGYFQRLVGLARLRLRGAPRQAADEEDVALSVFDSLWRAAEQGRFPRLDDRDDLWQVLVVLTVRKAANLAKHERAQKRDAGKARHVSALAEEEEATAFTELIGREPEPAFVAEVAEECRRLLGLLPDPDLRALAVWKMEGYTNDEIARLLDCSAPTVERKLRRIRGTWDKEKAS